MRLAPLGANLGLVHSVLEVKSSNPTPWIMTLFGEPRIAAYIHKIDSALLAAADRIARHIDDAMTGRKSNRVVQLRKA